MKKFAQALKDGFKHITHISDMALVSGLRDEHILVDEEGIYNYCFGELKEYELRIEPWGDDADSYKIALYKNNVLLTEKLLMKAIN